MFAKAAATVAGLAMVLGATLPAGATTVADIQAAIAQLQAQLTALQGGSTTTVTFTRDLTVGSSGADVTALQQILVSKGYLTIPAGTAYGYFGSLTKAAVARWQASASISPAAGYFGPISRAALSASATGTTTGGTTTGGTTTGGTTTGTTSGTITTPGAEGTIAVTSAPVSNSTVYENDRMDGIIAFNVKATGSDVAVQRVNVVLGSNTTEYNKIFQTLYVVDDAGRTLGSIDMNSTNVVKQSDNTYMATISGFSSVVSRGSQRTYTVKADIRSTIDSSVVSAGSYVVTIPVNGVRAIDGAGIDLYGPAVNGALTNSITTAKSLASSATITVSTDSNNPNAQEVVASTGAANNQFDKLPVLVFDIKADKDDIKLTDVNNVTITQTGSTGATASTTYLYAGNGTSGQILGTASASGSTSSFNNLSYVIPKGTTATFTIAADIRSANGTATTFLASLVGTNVLGTNSVGDTITGTGSATGNNAVVRSIGPVFSLAGTPTITKNAGLSIAGATSSAVATFNINIKAVGGDVIFGTQSASSTFNFAVYVGGVKQVQNVASTTSWSVPSSGVVTSGLATGQAFKLQQNNTVTLPVSFYFEGRTPAGVLVTSGTYAVGLESINWSLTDGVVKTSNFMAGRTEWRTTEIVLP
ncbi:MAG: hypothetical protein JWN50_208 [Parcubacteria group bacterium]|nr:hypothetical protein [Parcubacteria group bacterium]